MWHGCCITTYVTQRKGYIHEKALYNTQFNNHPVIYRMR